MIENYDINPYFRLFLGETITKKEIEEKAAFAKPAIETLLTDGRLIGQMTLDGDIEYRMLRVNERIQTIPDSPWEKEFKKYEYDHLGRANDWDFGETSTALDLPTPESLIKRMKRWFKKDKK